ncbi:MAG: TPM domain-containing protein [Cyanobacteria bacterium J06639_16]
MRMLLKHTIGGLLHLSRFLLAAIACFILTQAVAPPAAATGVYQMPVVANGQDTWIVDDANLISRLNEGKISDKLRQLAAESGNEVRFVTLHRLDYGETPQSFTDALFEKWFPTPESQANQTLIVLDDVTNGVAIRTGQTSATLLSPEIATSVTEESIKIPLREDNKYNQALIGTTNRLVAVLSGAPDPGPPTEDTNFEIEGTFATAEETEANRGNSTVIVIGFLIAATVIPMATYYFYLAMGG